MSAYIVDKAHINAMVQFGLIGGSCNALSWWHNDDRQYLNRETDDHVGQMLLDTNVQSVCYRYPDDSMASLPGRIDAEWLLPFKAYPILNTPTPLDIFAMVSCYEYQSCEHPEWETSEAKVFCDALRARAIRRLPGYDKAIRDWTPENDGNRGARLVRMI